MLQISVVLDHDPSADAVLAVRATLPGDRRLLYVAKVHTSFDGSIWLELPSDRIKCGPFARWVPLLNKLAELELERLQLLGQSSVVQTLPTPEPAPTQPATVISITDHRSAEPDGRD